MPGGWAQSIGGTIPVTAPSEVGPTGCMSIPAASRCVRLIAGCIARCGLRPINGAKLDIAARGIMRRPNAMQSWRVFKRTLASHRERYGNGVARAYPGNRAPGVPPTSLVTLLPYTVQLVVPEVGEPYYLHRTEKIQPADILHIKDDSEDGLLGESKVLAASRVLRVAAQADETMRWMMRNLGVAKLAIELQGNEGPTVRQEIADAYMKNHGGEENSAKPIVTSGGAKVHAIDVDLVNQAWIDARAWDAQQCSRIWGVPTPFLSEFSGSGGYGSLEILVRMLFDYCLADLFGEWDDELNRVLFGIDSDPVIEHDTDTFTRGTAQEVAGALTLLYREGLISDDEGREDLDLVPKSEAKGTFRTVATATSDPASQAAEGAAGGSGAGGPVPGMDTKALAGGTAEQ